MSGVVFTDHAAFRLAERLRRSVDLGAVSDEVREALVAGWNDRRGRVDLVHTRASGRFVVRHEGGHTIVVTALG